MQYGNTHVEPFRSGSKLFSSQGQIVANWTISRWERKLRQRKKKKVGKSVLELQIIESNTLLMEFLAISPTFLRVWEIRQMRLRVSRTAAFFLLGRYTLKSSSTYGDWAQRLSPGHKLQIG